MFVIFEFVGTTKSETFYDTWYVLSSRKEGPKKRYIKVQDTKHHNSNNHKKHEYHHVPRLLG